MSDFQHWYYINKDYQEDGPVSSEELKNMVKNGDIHKGTYVWTQELEEWVPASKVGGLFEEKKKQVVKPLANSSLSKKTGGFSAKQDQAVPTKPVEKKEISAKPAGNAATQPASDLQSQPAKEINTVPVPISAPQEIVAKPLTSAQPLPTKPGFTPTPAANNTSPISAHQEIIRNVPSSAPPTQASPRSTPTPMTAPLDIVPKPLTSAQPLRQRPGYSPTPASNTTNPISAPQQTTHGSPPSMAPSNLKSAPTPITAPQEIVPKPLSSGQPLRQRPGFSPNPANSPVETGSAPQEIVPKPLSSAQPLPQKPGYGPQTPAPETLNQKSIPAESVHASNPDAKTPMKSPIVPSGPSSIQPPNTSQLPRAIPLPNPLKSPSAPEPIAQQASSAAPIPPPGTAAGANSIPAPGAKAIPAAGQSNQSIHPPAPAPLGPPPPKEDLPMIPPVGRTVAPFNQTPTSALSKADQDPERQEPKHVSLDQ